MPRPDHDDVAGTDLAGSRHEIEPPLAGGREAEAFVKPDRSPIVLPDLETHVSGGGDLRIGEHGTHESRADAFSLAARRNVEAVNLGLRRPSVRTAGSRRAHRPLQRPKPAPAPDSPASGRARGSPQGEPSDRRDGNAPRRPRRRSAAEKVARASISADIANRSATPSFTSCQRLERAASRVLRRAAQHFLDADQLVVFGDTVGAATVSRS